MTSLSEQLELAAWQHELRDRHGRWTRSAGTVIRGSDYGTVIPVDQGEATRRQVQATAFTFGAVDAAHDMIGGPNTPKQNWTGTVVRYPQSESWSTLGETYFDKDPVPIRLSSTTTGAIMDVRDGPDVPARPDLLLVPLHEAIHLISKDRHEDGFKYIASAASHNIEEGFTELGTIQHAAEFFGRSGLYDRVGTSGDPLGWEAQYLRDHPNLIEEGEGYGHYGWQTAEAQRWVINAAAEEGHTDFSAGSPGNARLVELADEINRVGSAEKEDVMARQVMRSIGLPTEEEVDWPGPKLWRLKIYDVIHANWPEPGGEPDLLGGEEEPPETWEFAVSKARKIAAEEADYIKAHKEPWKWPSG